MTSPRPLEAEMKEVYHKFDTNLSVGMLMKLEAVKISTLWALPKATKALAEILFIFNI